MTARDNSRSADGTHARDVDAAAPAGAAADLRWLVAQLADEVPGIRQVVLVSSDGLILTQAGGDGDGGRKLGAIVSGLVSLADGAAQVLEQGRVRQQVVTMANSHVVVMSISDGSCLGVHADALCDLGVVAYQMTTLVRRAGHVLTPALRAQLHHQRQEHHDAS